MRSAGAGLRRNSRGNVVSITVTWVRNGSPYVVPSAMSKSAIHAMTMSLAMEWGRYGIRLNTIAPGEIPTEGMSKRLNPGDEPGARTIARNPMGRVGKMEELQNLAVFLISGGCDWINGETIAMDGAQALATGGNFYEMREWSDADWERAREFDQGAEREGPRVAAVHPRTRAAHNSLLAKAYPVLPLLALGPGIAGTRRIALNRIGNENKTPREKHVRHTSAGKPCRDGARARQEPRQCAGL